MNSPLMTGRWAPSSAQSPIGNHPPTDPQPVGAVDFKALTACLIDWLEQNFDETNGRLAVLALAKETYKRAGSTDPQQRQFDSLDLAQAAQRGEADSYDSAKKWIDRARIDDYVGARRVSIQAHFRASGHLHVLWPRKRSTGGKHRAVWFLEARAIQSTDAEEVPDQRDRAGDANDSIVVYDLDGPGTVKPALLARPLIGPVGVFRVRSWRGALWAIRIALLCSLPVLAMVILLGWTYERRFVMLADLAGMVLLALYAAWVWHNMLRPTIWLIEDRIVLVNLGWVSLTSDGAQIELRKDGDGQRLLQLVRYKASCPICTGEIELRYSRGVNRRRIVGCCSESPQEHVYSFDRILRNGHRVES